MMQANLQKNRALPDPMMDRVQPHHHPARQPGAKVKRDRKEDLMQLMAEEMMNSLLGGDEPEDELLMQRLQERLARREEARRAKKKRAHRRKKKLARAGGLKNTDVLACSNRTSPSLEDSYYAHLAGQVSTPYYFSDGETPVSKDFSAGELDHSLMSPGHKSRSTSTHSRGAVGGQYPAKFNQSSTSNDTSMTGSFSKDTASEALSPQPTAAAASMAGVSVDELRQYVMNNLPVGVREQVPEEAWAQIFQPQSPPPSSNCVGSREASPLPSLDGGEHSNKDVVLTKAMDSDEMTVMSDISGLTGAFPDGKSVECKQKYWSTFEALEEEEEKQGSMSQSDHPSQQPTEEDLAYPLYCAAAAAAASPQSPAEEGLQEHLYNQSASNNMVRRLSILNQRSSSFEEENEERSPSSGKKTVSFDTVEVRYYERMATDNPGVQSGVSMGIGWCYRRGGTQDVDSWESKKGVTRSCEELIISPKAREQLLKQSGVSIADITAMKRSIMKAKSQRKQTINNLSKTTLEEAVENTRRRMTKIMTFGMRR